MGRTRFLTTDDPEEGWSWVRDEIDSGRPSLVWGDLTRGLGPGLRCRSRRPWSTNDNRGWNPNPCL
ncbi:BtrH N-terminal domain-containing protein [Rhodococcus sp. D-46]|nr:BtrH N-terminal domain-containing protein [Rhodococcus sp. D-46]